MRVREQKKTLLRLKRHPKKIPKTKKKYGIYCTTNFTDGAASFNQPDAKYAIMRIKQLIDKDIKALTVFFNLTTPYY